MTHLLFMEMIITMRIGDKYFDKDNILTIYKIFKHSIKVRFNGETRYRYIKKSVLNTYRYLNPIGYIESFYIKDDKECDYEDLTFIFFPNLDSSIWSHSNNANPSLIKTRISDNISEIGLTVYDISMTNNGMGDDWFILNELERINKLNRLHIKRVSIYIDTSIYYYLKLLQETVKVYDEVVSRTSDIIIERYNSEFKKRTKTKDIIDFLSLFRAIEFSVDIMEGEYHYEIVDKNSRYGLVGINDIDVEDFICMCGSDIKDLIIIRYWYDIDLNSINMQHMLVRDPNTGDLYVFIYNDIGISQAAMNKAFTKYENSIIAARMDV